MKPGETKIIDKHGVKLEVMATDDRFLIMEGPEAGKEKQIGVVIPPVPANKFGITTGTKILLND